MVKRETFKLRPFSANCNAHLNKTDIKNGGKQNGRLKTIF